MGKLLIPNFPENQMGKVITTITVTNRIDQVLAKRGIITEEKVRSLTLNKVIIDTGATLLCLPTKVIEQLGLELSLEVDVATAAGITKARIFRDVNLSVEGREGTFDCLELPGGMDVLLGVIPLEQLGLEPDLKEQRLRVLPMNSEQTYLSIM